MYLWFQSSNNKCENVTNQKSEKVLNAKEERKEILSPRDMNKVTACQPVKKRILAYNNELIKSQEKHKSTNSANNANTTLSVQEVQTKKNICSKQIECEELTGATSNPADFVMLTPCKNYSYVKDLESLSPCSNAISFPSKVSVIKTTPPRFSGAQVGRGSTPIVEEHSRWNSALALIQLACSPPSKLSTVTSWFLMLFVLKCLCQKVWIVFHACLYTQSSYSSDLSHSRVD